MRPRTLVVLLGLVAALGGFIWFYERELPSTDDRAEQSKKLLQFDEDSVRSLTLVSGEHRVRLERTAAQEGPDTVGAGSLGSVRASQWLLAEPRRGRADDDEVEGFVERLLALEKLRTLEDVSRAQLGLDHPRAQVAVVSSSGEVVLRFGSRIPASENTVIEVGDGPPFYVVSDDLFEDIARESGEWRSRDALPYEEGRIEKIEILAPVSGVVLERAGEGFLLAAPIEDAADRSAVNELLKALVGLEVEGFVEDSDPSFRSVRAAVRLTVAGLARPVLVEVARRPAAADTPSRIRIDGEVFEVETDLASLLERAPAEWRSTNWTDLNAFEIETLRIRRRGSEEESFELHEGEWRTGGRDVDYAIVSALLRTVAEARGVPTDAHPVGAGSPEVEIELESNSGRVETLRLWLDEGRYTAERLDRAAGLELEARSSDNFTIALEELETSVDRDVAIEPE